MRHFFYKASIQKNIEIESKQIVSDYYVRISRMQFT